MRKTYGSLVAVDGVSFSISRGVYSIMGPNGSGKSTLLSIIAGSLRPDSGDVILCGYRVWGSEGIYVRAHLGYAPQDMPLRGKLSGYENLVWIGLLRGLSLVEARRRARELIELMDLSEHGKKLVSRYSGGLRKRLTIASAMIHDPEVLVLDEPASGLDPRALEDLWGILLKISRERVLIYSTHNPVEAERFSDIVMIMYRGGIIASGKPEDLIKTYAPKPRVVVWLPESVKPIEIEGLEMGVGRGFVYYSTEDPRSAVKEIVNAYARIGASITRIEIRPPGLDEVFLRLTGVAIGEGGEVVG